MGLHGLLQGELYFLLYIWRKLKNSRLSWYRAHVLCISCHVLSGQLLRENSCFIWASYVMLGLPDQEPKSNSMDWFLGRLPDINSTCIRSGHIEYETFKMIDTEGYDFIITCQFYALQANNVNYRKYYSWFQKPRWPLHLSATQISCATAVGCRNRGVLNSQHRYGICHDGLLMGNARGIMGSY
jgi:hypothetical protein